MSYPPPSYGAPAGYPPMAPPPPMMPIAPIVGAPAMMMGAPYPETPMAALDRVRGLWVSQKSNYVEHGDCCDFENKYRVYATKSSSHGVKKEKQDKLFKWGERSTCCQRYCMW